MKRKSLCGGVLCVTLLWSAGCSDGDEPKVISAPEITARSLDALPAEGGGNLS